MCVKFSGKLVIAVTRNTVMQDFERSQCPCRQAYYYQMETLKVQKIAVLAELAFNFT